MATDLSLLLDGLGFPEGPRWHNGRLWFTDQQTRKITAVTLDGDTETIAEVPGRPSGLGWLPDGRLLVVSMDRRRLLRLEPDGLVEAANLWHLASFHCNDMVVDRRGRAYVGHFGFDLDAPFTKPTLAQIIMVTPDGAAAIVADDLAFPNGAIITPDGKTLIVAETFAARLTAFDVTADGALTHRRTWARFDDLGVGTTMDSYAHRAVPDGICLDAQEGIWVASPGATDPAVFRVEAGGHITHAIRGAFRPYACMLGGANGRTLFILGKGLNDNGEPLPEPNGRILTTQAEIPHAGLP